MSLDINTSTCCSYTLLNIYLTFGNEKNGMATIIKSRPMSRKPNHHSPMNRLSDGSIFVKMIYCWKLEHYINVPLWIFLAVIDPLFVRFRHTLMDLWMESIIFVWWNLNNGRDQMAIMKFWGKINWMFWKFFMKFDSAPEQHMTAVDAWFLASSAVN